MPRTGVLLFCSNLCICSHNHGNQLEYVYVHRCSFPSVSSSTYRVGVEQCLIDISFEQGYINCLNEPIVYLVTYVEVLYIVIH